MTHLTHATYLPTWVTLESEIGRGYGEMSLKSELASMKARLVMEAADWAQMKGQASFGNIDDSSCWVWPACPSTTGAAPMRRSST